MELTQLRYVVALAEEANFTRAAARCFVVQSALSHSIKSLEAEVGTPLFARTSRRVELTAAGEAFLSAARASLEAAERAAVDARAATGEVRGRLTVGAIPTTAAVDVPEMLSAFHEAHPAARIVLRGGGSDQLEQAVAGGELDVAFLGLAPGRQPRNVAWRDLGADRLHLVVAPDHRLAGSGQVALEAVAGETFADFIAGSPGRAQTDLAFAAAGLDREVAFEAAPVDVLLGLVRRTLAVAFLPSRIVRETAGVVAVPVTDGPTRTEYLIWSDFNPSPAARAFVDVVAAAHSGMAPPSPHQD